MAEGRVQGNDVIWSRLTEQNLFLVHVKHERVGMNEYDFWVTTKGALMR